MLKSKHIFFAYISFLFCVSYPAVSQNPIRELIKGDNYCNNHEYEKAIIHYQKYLDKSKTLGKFRNLEKEADANRKIAYAYSTQGKYDKTQFHLKEALYADSIDNNNINFIEDIRLLGMSYAYSNEYGKTIYYLSKSIELSKKFSSAIKEDKLKVLSSSYLSLSEVNATLGDFSTSLAYAIKSFNNFTKIKDYNGLTQVLQQIAWLQIEKGDYPEAEGNLNRSIEYSKKQKLFTFEQYEAMGHISEKKHRYEDALRYRLMALAQADSSKIVAQVIWANIKLGDTYKALGQNDYAKKYYFKAMKLDNELGKSNLTPAIDYRTGNLLKARQSYLINNIKYGSAISALEIGKAFQKEQPDSAMFYYSQSLTLFKSFNNIEYSNKAIIQICELLIEQGNYQEALGKLLTISEITSNPETKWKTFFLIGKSYENLAQDCLAIYSYKNAINVIEDLRSSFVIDEFRDSYFSNKIFVYNDLIDLLQKNKRHEEAWFVSEQARARSFLDMIEGEKIGGSQSADSTLIKKEKELKAEISFLLKSIEAAPVLGDSTRAGSLAINKKLQDKQTEYRKILAQIETFKSKYIQLISAKTLSLRRVQNKIKDNHVIVEYWCGQDSLTINVISNDTFITEIRDIDSLGLGNKVQVCRNNISKSEDYAKVYLNELYRTLWEPIEDYILPNQKVCIIPHQELHNVPFAALYNGEGHYLISKYYIHYAFSASLFNNNLSTSADDSFLGIALKQSNVGNFNELKNTEREVKLIERFFSRSTLIIEDNLNESVVKKTMPDANIIHFATHGVYDKENPLGSYLLLNSDNQNDGKLTVSEIYSCNINSKLTTLSACQTAIGDISKGDEIVSLNRAFIYAGASNVISTLWEISDASTPELLNDFYKYFNQNYSSDEALCLAQRSYIRNVNPDPSLWAAFVLYN